MRNVRAALAAIVVLALAHAAFFIVYQRPNWNVAWTDQGGYRMLAHGLLATGTFTRYPDAPEFVALYGFGFVESFSSFVAEGRG